jgi:hypothetical protein
MSLLLAGNANAQVKSIEEVPVHLSLNEVKVEIAFKALEKITEFNFVIVRKMSWNILRYKRRLAPSSMFKTRMIT